MTIRTIALGTSSVVVAGLLTVTTSASPAAAVVPGTNGQIAFTNGDINIINPDGSGQTNLTEGVGAEYDPVFSPDSSKIAFISDRDGNAEVYVMNVDGTGQTNLTKDPAADAQPTWSPDGSKIAFARYADGRYSIYVMSTDGSGQTKIVDSSGGNYQPAWSPDGSKIAFTSFRDGNAEVYVANAADGTGQSNLTNNPAGDREPAFSPDGSHIAFTRDSSRIYVMKTDGTAQTALSGDDNPDVSDSEPAWSPDGSKIAVTHYDYNIWWPTARISVMNADGTEPTVITWGDSDTSADWGSAAPTPPPPPTTPDQADLSLKMAASSSTPTAGHDFTYTLTLTNAGPETASGVAVLDRVPTGTYFVRSSTPWPASYNDSTGLWSVGTLAAGATATLEITVRAEGAGEIVNTAEVSAADQTDPDSTPGNNNPAEDDQASVTVTAKVVCTTATETGYVDTWIAQNAPNTNYGNDTTLRVRSQSGANRRILIHFNWIPTPVGCKVTSAKIRLYATSAAAGRSLQAKPLANGINETTATWNNQPAVTGTAAYATSRAGWVEWTVTDQFVAGAYYGYRISDNSEGVSSPVSQAFSSYEATANRPQTVVTFAPK